MREGRIDTGYLQSDSYERFRRQSRAENRQAVKNENRFARQIEEVLPDNRGAALRPPATIDESLLARQAKDDQQGQPLITTLLGIRQIFHPLAHLQDGSFGYNFFLMCKIASYDDCLVWLAVTKQDRLISMRMITPYNNALSYKEIPTITVRPPRIRVEVNRRVEYPMSQLGGYGLQYRVDRQGKIYRVSSR